MSTPATLATPAGVTLRLPAASSALAGGGADVLAPAALDFVAALVRRFAPPIERLLARRREVARSVDDRVRSGGRAFDFLPETADVRADGWTVREAPPDLTRRHVEITGPVDRKMILNALSSGADVFMADFEDATAPTFDNVVLGQKNLREAVLGTLRHVDPKTGKTYELPEKPATLLVRPRGLHLPERHVEIDGAPAPGSLVDFGLHFFHCAKERLARGSGPYFYLPKLESHLEARLWNEVFVFAQDALGIPRGSIRATVLIETLPAAFEMDEILFELREHASGLNCGRWDYIFSFIKKHRAHPSLALPDRKLVTMDQGFLRAYSELLVKTCHRRKAHAMGGMAAFIPVKGDDEKNRAAFERVRADKLRELRAGHDGTWVAHPGLVPVAREVFDAMGGPHQLGVARDDVVGDPDDLLRAPEGPRTEDGLRENVRVGVQYLEAWLQGQGCVPLYDLMEDAATAEISRAQVWQWLHRAAEIEGKDGRRAVDAALVQRVIEEERPASEARTLFQRLVLEPEFEEFLTLPAYDRLCPPDR